MVFTTSFTVSMAIQVLHVPVCVLKGFNKQEAACSSILSFRLSVLITTSFYTGGSWDFLGTPEGWEQVASSAFAADRLHVIEQDSKDTCVLQGSETTQKTLALQFSKYVGSKSISQVHSFPSSVLSLLWKEKTAAFVMNLIFSLFCHTSQARDEV